MDKRHITNKEVVSKEDRPNKDYFIYYGKSLEDGSEIGPFKGGREVVAAGFNAWSVRQVIFGERKHHARYTWTREEITHGDGPTTE